MQLKHIDNGFYLLTAHQARQLSVDGKLPRGGYEKQAKVPEDLKLLQVARHKPKQNHLNPNAPENGFMFETFGEEFEFVRKQDFHNVFTIVEGDSGKAWYACTGFHHVNRIGYFVVEIPWTSENEHITYKT